MKRKGSWIPPAPPTPLGAYSHIMNATAPLASLGLAAGGTAAGLMSGNPMLGAALSSMGAAAPAAMLAPVTVAAQAEKGMLPRAPVDGNGPAAMALMMRSMGSKMGEKPEAAKPATAVTAPTHGMSAGQMNSYADQVKQEQRALDGGVRPPDYAPSTPAPRTTPIANTPQQPDSAMQPGPRSLAEQRRRQLMNGGM